MYSPRFVTHKGCMLLVAIIFSMQHAAEAQPKATAKTGNAYVILTYDVGDLVLNVPDHPYAGTSNSARPTMPMGGMGGGGMGGGDFGIGGMGMAGGMGGMQKAREPMLQSSSGKITMAELYRVIAGVVASDTWGPAGGEGSLMPLGNSLVIRQTAEVHRQIGDLLKQLRAGAATQKTVAIDARWLLLDSDDLDRLISTQQKGCPLVNRKILAEYTRRPSSIRGLTNSFSGQLVYLVSGTRRNFVSGYVPVVGSVDRPGQKARQFASLADDARVTYASNITTCSNLQQGQVVSSSSVGYQPQIEKTNLGALLEIRATLTPDNRRAIVDLRSTITVPGKNANQQEVIRDLMVPTMDRVAIDTQELATTLSVPLGQPVLAGGITYVAPSLRMFNREEKTPPSGSSSTKSQSPKPLVAEEAPQLYLILELR